MVHCLGWSCNDPCSYQQPTYSQWNKKDIKLPWSKLVLQIGSLEFIRDSHVKGIVTPYKPPNHQPKALIYQQFITIHHTITTHLGGSNTIRPRYFWEISPPISHWCNGGKFEKSTSEFNWGVAVRRSPWVVTSMLWVDVAWNLSPCKHGFVHSIPQKKLGVVFPPLLKQRHYTRPLFLRTSKKMMTGC